MFIEARTLRESKLGERLLLNIRNIIQLSPVSGDCNKTDVVIKATADGDALSIEIDKAYPDVVYALRKAGLLLQVKDFCADLKQTQKEIDEEAPDKYL